MKFNRTSKFKRELPGKFHFELARSRKRIRTRKWGKKNPSIVQGQKKTEKKREKEEQRVNTVTKGCGVLASSILTETSVFYAVKEELHGTM